MPSRRRATVFVCLLAVSALARAADDPGGPQYPDQAGVLWWNPLTYGAETLCLFHADEAVPGEEAEEETPAAEGGVLLPMPEAGPPAEGEARNANPIGRPGQLLGEARFVPEGYFGGGLRLGGGGDGLLVRGHDLIGPNTVAFWIRLERYPATEAALFSVVSTRCKREAFSLRLLADGHLRLDWHGEARTRSDASLPLDRWIYLSTTWTPKWPSYDIFLDVQQDGRPLLHLEELPTIPEGESLRFFVKALLVVGNDQAGASAPRATLDEIHLARAVLTSYAWERFWEEPREPEPPFTHRLVRDPKDLILHLPFDRTLAPAAAAKGVRFNEASLAEGLGELDPAARDRLFPGGVRGQALRLGPEGMRAEYESGERLLRSDAGTLTFWFRPENWDNHTRDNIHDNKPRKDVPLLGVFGRAGPGGETRGETLLLEIKVMQTPDDREGRVVDIHPGRWTHVAFTWHAGRWRAYADGEPCPLRPEKVWARDANWLIRRNRWDGSEPYRLVFPVRPQRLRTRIDELRIYRRNLAPAEIANLAALYHPRKTPRPLPPAELLARPNGPSGWIDVECFPLTRDYAALDAVRLTLAKAGAATPLAERAFDLSPDVYLPPTRIEDLAMDFGPYRLAAELNDAKAETRGAAGVTFAFDPPPWWNCNAGLTEKVLPEWNPLRVEGETVVVDRRRIRLAPSGLPAAVHADGEPILAGPVALEAMAGGNPLPLAPDRASVEVYASGDRATSFAGGLAGGGLRVETKGRAEFDGMMWFEVTLRPDGAVPVALDALTVRVPYAPASATMIHWFSGGRSGDDRDPPDGSYTGFLPEGEGAVFRSNDASLVAPDPAMRGSFLPYLSLVGDARGMAWFAENDRGWTQSRETPAVRVLRSPEAVVLELRVISESIILEAPRTFAFGLHPVPVRRRDPLWRANPAWGVLIEFGGGMKGGPDTSFDVVPKNEDWAMAERELNREEGEDGKHQGIGRRAEGLVEAFQAFHGRPPHSREVRVPGLYMILNGVGNLPEHTRDWGPHWHAPGGRMLYYSKNVQDYLAWAWNEWVRRGLVKGVYMDNTYLRAHTDAKSPVTYRLPDGHIQPGWQILALRERMRRLRQILHNHGVTPHVCAHCTLCFHIPYLSFIDVHLEAEKRYSSPTPERMGTDFLDHFPPGELRYRNSAKWGLIPEWLGWTISACTPDPDKVRPWWYRQERAYHAGLALHDIAWKFHKRLLRDFGLCREDVTTIPYWRSRDAARHAHGDRLRITAWTRPGRCLALLVNYGDARLDAEVRFDPEALGFPAGTALEIRDVDASLLDPVQFEEDITRAALAELPTEGLTSETADDEADALLDLEEAEEVDLNRATHPDAVFAWDRSTLRCAVRRHDYRLFAFFAEGETPAWVAALQEDFDEKKPKKGGKREPTPEDVVEF